VSVVCTRLCYQPASSQRNLVQCVQRPKTHFPWMNRRTRLWLVGCADEGHPVHRDTTTTNDNNYNYSNSNSSSNTPRYNNHTPLHNSWHTTSTTMTTTITKTTSTTTTIPTTTTATTTRTITTTTAKTTTTTTTTTTATTTKSQQNLTLQKSYRDIIV